jgi:uncharacterized protein (TIGR02285 family)
MTSDPVYTDSKETMTSAQLAYLTTHLAGFSHRIVKVSSARAVHELEHGPGVCSTAILATPDREKILTFSKRRLPQPGFRLLVRKDRIAALAPAITGKGDIDLAKLQDIPSLLGGYTNSRRYGPAISDFIEHYDKGRLNGEVATFQVINLLEKQRIDFAFVLPMDFYFYVEEDDRGQNVLLPVVGETREIMVGIACTADPAGQAVMRAIDTLLADDAHWAEYVEPLRKWNSPEDFEALRASH